MNYSRPSDPYSGRNSPGPRFRFRDRFISRKTFWLPVAMKRDPDFPRLLDVLHSDGRYADPSIRPLARDKFNQLRLKYDFAFWAATVFRIPHVDDADREVPLILNDIQRYIADRFDQANAIDRPLRFIIEKETIDCKPAFHRTGVSTLVNAYICWTQTSRRPGMNSMTVTEHKFQSIPLKSNFRQTPPSGGRGAHPSRFKIRFPSIDASAHFATSHNPDAVRGIDFALLHLVNISEWDDPDRSRSETLTKAAFPSVWQLPQSMIILDGAPTHRNHFFNSFLRSSLLSETSFTPILLTEDLIKGISP